MEQEMKVRLVADAAGFDTGLKKGTALYDRFGKEIQSTSTQISKSVSTTQRSFNNLGRVAGSSGASVLAFSRIVQDAPFGIIGVGNNITQLVESFSALRASSKSTGAAMKSFFTSLIAPGNLLVLAISAATTALTFFAMRSRGAKDATDNLRESLLSLSDAMVKGNQSATEDLSKLDAIYRITQDVTRSMDERKKAVDSLQDQYPSYFGNLDDEKILVGEASGAYKSLRENIIGAAQAQALMDQVVEREKAYLELQPQKLAALEKSTKAQQELNNYLEIYNATAIPDQGMVNHLNMLQAAAVGATKEFQELVAQGDELRNESHDFAEQLKNYSIDDILGLSKGKGGKSPAREEIEAIGKDLQAIDSPIINGLNKAAGTFETGLENAISNAAQKLSNEDFAKVLKRAFSGDLPEVEVKAILTPILGRDSSREPDRLDLLEARLNEFGRTMTEIANYSDVLLTDLRRNIGNAFYGMLVDGENIFDAIGDAFKRMIATMVADLAAAQIPKLLGSIFNAGLGAAGGAAVVGGIGGLLGGVFKFFGGLFKGRAFADGGIVSGPTLSLTGEYPGARSNPEVIAPLNKLRDLLPQAGNNVVVMDVEIPGDKLLLVQRRAERRNSRFFG